MIKVVGLLLGIFFLMLIYINYKRKQDLFEPSALFVILEFIAYVPGMFLFEAESSVTFTVSGCLKVLFFEIIYVFGALLGIGFSRKILVSSNDRQLDIPMFNIIVCYILGFSAKVLVIKKLGGLGFVLSNMQYAYLLQAHGYGIYTMFYKFMVVAILAMFEKCALYKEKRSYKLLLVVMMVLYALSFLIYTSRTPALIMVLIALFVYNYQFQQINFRRLFKPKFILVFVLCVAVAYSATLSRTANTNKVSNSMFADLFYNYTNIGRDICVYEYFSEHDKWLGKGYLNIIPSLIPGVDSKPSTDDGIYLVNIIRGYDVDINANSDSLPVQTGSVPFSTPGYMYANFGGIGVALGGILMGLLIGLAYKYMDRNMNAFSIAVYFYMIYSFGLSTGRMVPTLISIVFIFICIPFIRLRFSLEKRNGLDYISMDNDMENSYDE